ncbi:cytidine deaminase [Erysipelothrix sp. strain 2 (EsS2-6-Brazil)]|uniref:cytidine deaminase n=1 Tax=Erysipelothrix sp. strain 2 (EsS2-6-Brazil) TaxID=2500549 RepID=UPI00190A4C46|nr:cytidine deaminase [Erysipelothrix sp. strain 2 (EsS2-6-Brazil)]MBK2402460.1 cytidine deaminase [Erysipelothrix sp. strain 2 (EsS2-6-Brazil)]
MKYSELIEIALQNSRCVALSDNASLDGESTAMLSKDGTVFTGISVQSVTQAGCNSGVSAIAEALKSGQSHFIKMVTVNSKGDIIAPSGQTRDLLAQINSENKQCEIMVSKDHLVILDQLLPYTAR